MEVPGLGLSGGKRAALLAGYVAASFLAFPHPVGERVVDLGLVLAWLAPALLVLGLDGLAPRRAARLGFAAGLAAHAAILHWIYVVTVVYGGAPPIVGVLAPVGLAAYIAAFTAAFGAGSAGLARLGVGSCWALALLWTGLDHLRSFFLTGFPWATLGYAQHQNVGLLGLAPYTGVYGLSFASALGGAALAECVRARRATVPALAAFAAVALAHLPGLLAPDPDPGAPRIRVAVAQGNIDQGTKWDPDFFEATVAAYEDLTRRAAAAGAEVVVWPESALPVGLDGRQAEPLRRRVAALAQETGTALVVGSVGLAFEGHQVSDYFDSAYLVTSAGAFRDRYDKTHLVPFGEYVPLQDLIGRVVSAVARGAATVGVSPGERPRALSLPRADAPTLRVGIPICYELIFPNLVRHFVRDGAGLLLAITNDAWYGRTGAPFQFLAITALRSAETRVWTARAANTGVSAVIDARGRVRARTPIFQRDWLVADVPYRPPPVGGSFYVRHGDVFAACCWIALAALAGLGGLRRSRR